MSGEKCSATRLQFTLARLMVAVTIIAEALGALSSCLPPHGIAVYGPLVALPAVLCALAGKWLDLVRIHVVLWTIGVVGWQLSTRVPMANAIPAVLAAMAALALFELAILLAKKRLRRIRRARC
jgi:hypothetical protein